MASSVAAAGDLILAVLQVMKDNPQVAQAGQAILTSLVGSAGSAASAAATSASAAQVIAGLSVFTAGWAAPIAIVGYGVLYALQSHGVVGTSTPAAGTAIAGIASLGGLGVWHFIKTSVGAFLTPTPPTTPPPNV